MKPFVYETMYILRPDLTEDLTQQAIAKYQNLLTEQGAYDLEIQLRGKRRLAYEIDNHRDGIYVQMNYQGPPAQIVVLEKAMRFDEQVIRYMTIKQDIQETKPESEETSQE
ncbi:MAG: 30S ribosomal protein S6 [Okeania sp. SIO2H7]|nr:30S ribosomal protein S6 [Okeania sp. SIO2H7]